MKIILKVLLFPITLILVFVVSFCKFLLTIGGAILTFVSIALFLVALVLLFTGKGELSIWAVAASYLISPYGIPMMALWLIKQLEVFNKWLKSI